MAPCLVALRQVLAWYFVDYLKRALPVELSGEAIARAGGPALVMVSTGCRFPLVRGRSVVIGRDLKVHRTHARIDVPASGPPTLHELTGKNPTRVNDARIAGSIALQHGDHVQLGRTILRVELDDQGV